MVEHGSHGLWAAVVARYILASARCSPHAVAQRATQLQVESVVLVLARRGLLRSAARDLPLSTLISVNESLVLPERLTTCLVPDALLGVDRS